MSETKQKEMSLEEHLRFLEHLLEEMESEDVSFEESFELYKKGIACVKEANKKLDAIEKEMLIMNQDGELEEF